MDGTGVVQLLRRKCSCILSIIGEEDVNAELDGLKKVISLATEERLVSFFDPQNPRRNLQVMFDEFQADESIEYLHLKYEFGWDRELGSVEDSKSGDLIVVKLRVPPRLADERMKPPLSEELIMNSPSGTITHE